ncbi:glycine cleavage system protein H [Oceanobacillus bengalensis]|uniref:glycine cleavage system protein H n=1 Tax=Oceanobacillus bengalensis TaxID=1435466 RepID=UPI00363A50EC
MDYSEVTYWIRQVNGKYKIGLSLVDDMKGDITILEIRDVGEIASGETFVQVETSKAVSELFSPVTGKIIEINEKLLAGPQSLKYSDEKENWIAILENVSEEELAG